MTDVISITLPIFLLVALGFGAVRFNVVDDGFIRGLGFFVLNFALPALVLHALVGQDFRQTFDPNFVLAYGGGSIVVMLAMLGSFRFLLRRDGAHAAIAALGGVASNSGFVGFPVASLAVGAPALAALPMAMLVENVLVIPLALGLAEAARHAGKGWPVLVREAAVRLIRMPLVIAILAGIALSLLGVRMPAFLATTVDMMSNASAACALFTVGGTLAMLRPSHSTAGDVAVIVACKLLLHPLAVAAGFWLLGGVPAPLMAAGLILAASPMLTVYPIFGQRFGLGPLASVALLAATAASFVTLTLMLGFFLVGVDGVMPR
ncbi:MAG: AEC family transporter [Rhizobiaceae bacterium]